MNDRPLAVFDLDGTLVRGDCLLPFFVGYGRRFRRSSLPGMVVDVSLYAAGLVSARTAKQRVVRRVLGGEKRERIEQFAQEFCLNWVDRRLHPVGLPLLRHHQEQGHRVIILSASPSVYVPIVARHLGVDEVVCTTIRFDGDHCAGDIVGENCKGPAKVELLQAHLSGSSWSRSYAYGDSRSDEHILSWADQGFLITRIASQAWSKRR